MSGLYVNPAYPAAERDMLEIHRIVNNSQVRQRHAAALQKLDVGATTAKAPAERSAPASTASAGRKMRP